jgi:hypothetical protein
LVDDDDGDDEIWRCERERERERETALCEGMNEYIEIEMLVVDRFMRRG